MLKTYEENDPSGCDLQLRGRHGHTIVQQRHVEMEGEKVRRFEIKKKSPVKLHVSKGVTSVVAH